MEKEKKIQTNFTMKEGIRKKFLEHCEEKGLNKSRILEILIESYLEQNGKPKKTVQVL